ncbi:hypothetical protein TURU_050285 [Turdus rufiventris]|nr:hypothetical protein TURU_050285 [Turdus rufiventris]
MSKASLEQPGTVEGVGDGIDGNDGNDPQGIIQPKPFQDSLVFNHESLCTAVYKHVYEQEFNSVILTAALGIFYCNRHNIPTESHEVGERTPKSHWNISLEFTAHFSKESG